MPKTGVHSGGFGGELYLADISVPAPVYESFGLPTDLFGDEWTVRLT